MLTRGVTLLRNRASGLSDGRSLRVATIVFSRTATLLNSSTSRASRAGRLSLEREDGGGTSVRNPTESSLCEPMQEKNARLPTVLPVFSLIHADSVAFVF